MTEYLIQGDTLSAMANQVRRIACATESGSYVYNRAMNGAEILEVMSRIHGTVKTDGKYRAIAWDPTTVDSDNVNFYGNAIKNYGYNTGEVFALPIPPTKDNATFKGWSCTSPIECGNYVFVGNCPIRAGAIYTFNDDIFKITVNIKEANTVFDIYPLRANVVDWGDGNISQNSMTSLLSHTYVEAGTYTIQFLDEVKMIYSEKSNINSGYNDSISYENAEDITDVKIPLCITDISSFCFKNCTSLKNIVLHDKITTIRRGAFSNCTSLTFIVIPYSVTKFGDEVFLNCKNLRSVVLPYGLTEIPSQTFYGCTGITDIIIPESVTSIGSSAFNGCTGIETLTLHYTYIGRSAFYNTNMKNLILCDEKVYETGKNIFGEEYAGFKGVNIYVPDSLVDSYKADEYWTVFSDYIKPISEYVA